jgi:hypothetical protein
VIPHLLDKLKPFLGRDVHVSVFPIGICQDGQLLVRGDALTLDSAPALRIPLSEIQICRPTPIGPRELSEQADLIVDTTDDLFVQVYEPGTERGCQWEHGCR